LLFLTIVTVGLSSAQGTISVVPSATSVAVGSTFTASIQASGVTDLYALQFDVSFNPALFSAVSATEGTFLPSGGTTFFVPGNIDNVGGHVTFVADTLSGTIPGVNGSGTVAIVTFKAIAAGNAAISLANVIALNSTLATVSVTTQASGTVTVGSTPTPSIMTIVSGSNQSTVAGTAFSTALAVKITDASSNPISGLTVTFTAPTSGASGTFAGGGASTTAVTNASGVATAPAFTANATAGSIAVTAAYTTLSTTINLTSTHASASVPTLSEWGLGMLALLLLVSAAWQMDPRFLVWIGNRREK
jgi:hypothetical protein